MTTPTDIELRELKELISQGFSEVKGEIKQLETKIVELNERQVRVEARLDGLDKRLSSVETSVQKIPDLAEKVGELKNWRQIALIVISVIVAATFGWFLRDGKL